MVTSHNESRRRRRIVPILALALALPAPPVGAAILMQDTGEEVSQEAPIGRWESFGVSSSRSRISTEARSVSVALAPGDRASFARTADLSPAPTAVLCAFNVSLSGIGAEEAVAQVLRMGWDFGASNGDEAAGRTYAELGLVSSGRGFQLRDRVAGDVSAAFEGTQAVSWVLNNSGRTLKYAAPNGVVEAIHDDRMDVWVGRTRVFDDIVATNPSGRITDLKWHWSKGSGITSVDRFEIRTLEEATGDLAAAPGEPAAAAPAVEASSHDGALVLGRPTPNPFSRTMRFAYSIPGGSAAVDIGVFDVAGRRIRVLARGTQATGQYEAVWDGLGDDGARVRHGVYFLRAAVGSQRTVSRLVYLKE